MSEAEKLRITIVHSLPGRLRARLSDALTDVDRFRSSVLGHIGLDSVDYTPLTRSVLISFDPRRLTQEEVVIRLGLAVSLDHETVPVAVTVEKGVQDFSNSAAYAGLLLLTALAGRTLNVTNRTKERLDWIAGLGTAGAVLGHGWREVRSRGYFDPEVLSLGYLATAMLRGNFIKAALVTWLTTFGRHLLEMPEAGVEIRPVHATRDGETDPHYEVVVAPNLDTVDRAGPANILRAIVKYAITGSGTGREGNLLADIRDISKVHGEVLHGLGWMRQGIPMRFE